MSESILSITHDMLKEWQSWDLDMKIKKSKQTIIDWYDHYKGNVYVAFSGGKDSTVLLHLIRKTIKDKYPDAPPVEAVFSNTGLEFPEIVSFVKSIPDVTIVRPKMNYLEVIKKYGYAILSKKVAMGISRFRNTKSDLQKELRLFGGTNPTSGKKQHPTIPKKFHHLVDAPFKISEACCDQLKKRPFSDFEKISKKKPFIGTMASDSNLRKMDYLKHSCNAFDKKKPQSRPLSHWLEKDIWDYIACFNVPYSEIYKEYDRTGCMWCAFGVHMEEGENRFQKLSRTHPKIWKYCMDKMGLRKVMEYIGIDVGKIDE